MLIGLTALTTLATGVGIAWWSRVPVVELKLSETDASQLMTEIGEMVGEDWSGVMFDHADVSYMCGSVHYGQHLAIRLHALDASPATLGAFEQGGLEEIDFILPLSDAWHAPPWLRRPWICDDGSAAHWAQSETAFCFLRQPDREVVFFVTSGDRVPLPPTLAGALRSAPFRRVHDLTFVGSDWCDWSRLHIEVAHSTP